MEYWDPSFLFDLAGGIGEPLKIDGKTIRKELGTYARILIDVDLSKPLVEEILVQRERFEFLTYMEYENLPEFCRNCAAVGHDVSRCKSVLNPTENRPAPRPQNQHVRRDPRRDIQHPVMGGDVSDSDDSECLRNVAVNTIMQSYDNAFWKNNQEAHNFFAGAEEDDTIHDDPISHVSETPTGNIVGSTQETQAGDASYSISSTPDEANSRREENQDLVQTHRTDRHAVSSGSHTINSSAGQTIPVCSTVRESPDSRINSQVDEDGFRMVLTKSQMRNWRKKLSKQKNTLQPIPYGLRSRAKNNTPR